MDDRTGPREVLDYVECIADGESVALPLERAGRWVECTIAALPLSVAWVRGIAVFEDQVLLCIGTRPRSAPPLRRSHGVVVDVGGKERAARWLLEVDLVVGMGKLEVRSRARHRSLLGEGRTADGRTIPLFDPLALVDVAVEHPRARTA